MWLPKIKIVRSHPHDCKNMYMYMYVEDSLNLAQGHAVDVSRYTALSGQLSFPSWVNKYHTTTLISTTLISTTLISIFLLCQRCTQRPATWQKV